MVIYIAQSEHKGIVVKCCTSVAEVWDICTLLPSRHGMCEALGSCTVVQLMGMYICIHHPYVCS